MANPFLFFESLLDSGTVTATSEAAGFPVENLSDWRQGTPYRWKATTNGTQNIDIDLGAAPGFAACDTICIGGHNLGTGGATYSVQHDSTGAFGGAETTVLAAQSPSDDLPQLSTFTGANVRYWRVIIAGTPSAVAQIGILTLGRRLAFTAGVQPGLDPYGAEAVADDATSENGSPLGTNLRYIRRRFNIFRRNRCNATQMTQKIE